MAEKFDVEEILEKLTTNEKIGLLSGMYTQDSKSKT